MKALAAMTATRRWEAGLVLSLLATFAWLAWRDLGAFPVIFADEQVYSKLARLVPLGEASLTAYLYFSVFKLTNACGSGFLDCTRLLNLVFLVGSAPLVYLVARRVASKPAAVAAALLSVLAPLNMYAGFFMPESMYVFAFWLMSAVALAGPAWHWARRAVAVGALLGVMMLVKVHALFLTPALALYLVYAGWNQHREGPWLRIGVASAVIAVGAAFAVKYSVGYVVAGAKGLSLLGSLYEVQASDTVKSGASLRTLLPGALLSLQGHLLMLATVFAVPVASAVYLLFKRPVWAAAGSARGAVLIWTWLMLGAALGMAVFYTSSVAGSSDVEGLRLHSRYYNFTFGLLLVLAAVHSSAESAPRRSLLRWAIALGVAAALVYAITALPVKWFLLLGDGPEFISLGLKSSHGWAAGVLAVQIAALAAWAGNEKLGGYIFLFVFLPAYALNSVLVNRDFVTHNHVGNLFDRAGQAAHKAIPPDQRNSLTIIGPGGDLMRTKFHVDAPDIDLVDVPWDWPVYPEAIPGRKQWLLVVGTRPMPDGLDAVLKTAEYTLVRLNPNNRPLGAVKMTDSFEGTLLKSVSGLSGPVAWGRWSNDREVSFKFAQPLPRRLNVFLTAQGLTVANVGKELLMRVGAQERRFILPAMPQEVHLQFETDGAQDVVSVTSPEPQTRPLGIGVWKIEIGTPDK